MKLGIETAPPILASSPASHNTEAKSRTKNGKKLNQSPKSKTGTRGQNFWQLDGWMPPRCFEFNLSNNLKLLKISYKSILISLNE